MQIDNYQLALIKKIALFFTFFPFFNPVFFLPFETAPYAGGIALVFVMIYTLNAMNNGIVKKNIFLSYLYLIICFFYINVFMLGDGSYISSLVRLFFSFVLGLSIFSLFSIGDNVVIKNNKMIIYYIIAWIIVGFLQISPFKYIVTSFLQLIQTRSYADLTGEDGGRGISLLASEPSYAGICLVSFLLVIDYIRKLNFITRKKHYILKFLLILMIVLTKSANSLMLFLFYLILMFFLYAPKKLRITAIIFAFIIPIILPTVLRNLPIHSRSIDLLILLLENPKLVLLDQSVASRFYFISMSYYGFFRSFGLGNGLGSYSYLWSTYANELHLENIY